ncbi:MAG: biotin--[acetyl-CoA-carboxylase] ligase [Oscillospiraceae bacterium]|nr:biotin--[acetyl-CoA-carboxylase] ligase [Oscillospiraceae bacterium]
MSTKASVLELLENKRGESISGEYIAECLKVSRSAVWKAVKELERDGYKINAGTNKGYCLCPDNDILSVQGMLPFLSGKGMSAKISVHPCLESTNITAKELATAGAESGTVVIADSQTAGRGRYERSFFSPPGCSIYMSFILRPAQVELPTLVTSYAAVSVCEAIEAATGKTPKIKWVNDVFLDGKKICGILTEAITDFESGNMPWIVVGIGVNFKYPEGGFPEEIKNSAGAVFSEKPAITRNQLAAEITNRMLNFEARAENKELLCEYKRRLMMLGKRVFVTGLKESFEATAEDIDDTGALIVKKDNGETLSLSSGEISLKML